MSAPVRVLIASALEPGHVQRTAIDLEPTAPELNADTFPG
jgi:hypothetical protein